MCVVVLLGCEPSTEVLPSPPSRASATPTQVGAVSDATPTRVGAVSDATPTQVGADAPTVDWLQKGPGACKADDDCIVVQGDGCGDCCPPAPRAVNRFQHRAREQDCARRGAPRCLADRERFQRDHCPKEKPEPASHFGARCDAGLCSLARLPTAPRLQ